MRVMIFWTIADAAIRCISFDPHHGAVFARADT